MKKYLVQILVVLLMLAVAWALYLIGANEERKEEMENKLTEASVYSARLPIDTSPSFLPIRNWSIKEPEITAQSAILMTFKYGEEKGDILYHKNINQVLPIASLSKIMTAIIVLENFDLEEVIKVSKNSISTLGDNGNLIRGEELTAKDLLYTMLMESSNDAAMALSGDSRLTYDEFISLMNSKAKELGLENTHFIDSIGLNSYNKSTVFELAKLINYSFDFPFLWEVLKTSEIIISSIDNKFFHNLINTNELLDKISFLNGGKTGFTNQAGGCMLTAFSFGSNNLITVVLGSEQREEDTEKLINWSKEAWIFSP